MRRRTIVVAGLMTMFLALPLAAQTPSDAGGPADPPAAEATADLTAGMSCVTVSGVEDPDVLGGAPTAAAAAGPIPDCPVNFSDCEDVPGRKCGLRNCVTVDLGYSTCRRNRFVISCRNGNLQQTTCDCVELLHLVCCDLGTCEFGECGVCTGGSLTTVCP